MITPIPTSSGVGIVLSISSVSCVSSYAMPWSLPPYGLLSPTQTRCRPSTLSEAGQASSKGPHQQQATYFECCTRRGPESKNLQQRYSSEPFLPQEQTIARVAFVRIMSSLYTIPPCKFCEINQKICRGETCFVV